MHYPRELLFQFCLHDQRPCPLPYLKLFKASCRTMVLCSKLFTMDMNTLHMTLTSSMPLYPPPPIGMSTIIVRVIASVMYPSRNNTCVISTNFFHFSLSGYVPLAASCSHVFRYSVLMTDGTTASPVLSFCTGTAIFSTSGGLSAIITGCNRIVSGSPSGGRRL